MLPLSLQCALLVLGTAPESTLNAAFDKHGEHQGAIDERHAHGGGITGEELFRFLQEGMRAFRQPFLGSVEVVLSLYPKRFGQ